MGGGGQFNVNKQTKFIPDAFSKKCKKVIYVKNLRNPQHEEKRNMKLFIWISLVTLFHWYNIEYWIVECLSLQNLLTIILNPHNFILPTYSPSTIMVSARAMECMERNNLEVYHPKLSIETRPTFLISWSESLCSSDLLFLHSPNIVLWPKIELHSCKIQLLVCWFAKLDW